MNIPKYIDEYRNELTRKGYRLKTIENYISSTTKFLFYFKDRKDHEHVNETDIKNYLRSYSDHNTQRSIHSSIKCFYKYVCRQPNKFRYIEYCKRSRRLPIVLSVDEMRRLIDEAINLKHKAILCLMYSTGMRVGEVINLKIENIDSSRMIINIINAKGGKDRQVTLDPLLLQLLRLYYIEYHPTIYLFNGQGDLAQYSVRSIAQFLNTYAEKSGLKKRIYPHLIRHCYATHLHEGGVDLSILQGLLGHSSLKTTQIYSHISHNHISKIRTPLQDVAIANYINQLTNTQKQLI